ncbi:hypothetical protein BI355_2248 (plasmid) [Companilactobacillus crustorum]|nr:hypothetical protein BI355_2248 [Companilactobacillus crustorum]
MTVTDPRSPLTTWIFFCSKKTTPPLKGAVVMPNSGLSRHLHYLRLSSRCLSNSRNTPTSSGAMIA